MKSSTGLQYIRDGVVVWVKTTLQHLGEDMKGVIELGFEEKSFDESVTYAKSGVVNVLKESACIDEASMMRMGAESQKPA